MAKEAVIKAYARWAPVYDLTFGLIANAGRKNAVDIINRRRGRVLEVGVGTGISLPRYKRHLKITGIDLSPDMLERARERVAKHQLGHVEDIVEMDAAALDFEDDSFDTVVAMYVLTVVPDPAKVMTELERVCAPGGEVIIINHFSQTHGVRGLLEKALAPFAERLGWRPEFGLENVTTQASLHLHERMSLRPFGLFTLLRFVRDDDTMAAQKGAIEDDTADVAAGGKLGPGVQDAAL
jgi:phosphatidylethanolamine/phosphatidyl-N-methylethanolamine N-methyltransferase